MSFILIPVSFFNALTKDRERNDAPMSGIPTEGSIISASLITCALLGGPRGPNVAMLDSVAEDGSSLEADEDGRSLEVDEADVVVEFLTDEVVATSEVVFQALFLINLRGVAVARTETEALASPLLEETGASALPGYWAGCVGAEAAIHGPSDIQKLRTSVPKRKSRMRSIR